MTLRFQEGGLTDGRAAPPYLLVSLRDGLCLLCRATNSPCFSEALKKNSGFQERRPGDSASTTVFTVLDRFPVGILLLAVAVYNDPRDPSITVTKKGLNGYLELYEFQRSGSSR